MSADMDLLARWLDQPMDQSVLSPDSESKIVKPMSDDKLVDFMIAEYENLRERRDSLDKLGESRVNFFLATISGALVGLTLLVQVPYINDIVHFIVALIIIGILWIGFTMFARMVSRSINLILLDRGMNRIRRYFVDKNPEIKDYISLPIYDDMPRLSPFIVSRGRYNLRGFPPTIAIINGMIACIGVVLLFRSVIGIDTMLSILIGGLIFILVISLQYRYYADQVKKEAVKQQAKVRFPSKTD